MIVNDTVDYSFVHEEWLQDQVEGGTQPLLSPAHNKLFFYIKWRLGKCKNYKQTKSLPMLLSNKQTVKRVPGGLANFFNRENPQNIRT